MQQPPDKVISMRDRGVMVALLVLLALALCSTIFRLPLTFDASYYLLKILEDQTAFCPHNRIGQTLLQLPTLAAAHFSQQITLPLAVFCFSYSTIPLLSLLASWLVLRSSKPLLIVWPAIGILLVTMPVLQSFVLDTFAAGLFSWPLFLMALTPPTKVKSALMLMLALWLSTLHPLTVVPISLTAISLLIIGKRNNGLTDQTLVVAAGLLTIVMLRVYFTLVFPSTYEKEHLGILSLVHTFVSQLKSSGGVLSYLCSIACGACMFLSQRRQSSGLFTGGLALVLLSLLFSLYRASDFSQWWQFTSYGRALPMLYIPLMIFAFLESTNYSSWTELSSGTTWMRRTIILNLAALALLATCLVQGLKWSAAIDALAVTISQNKQEVIEAESLSFQNANVLAFWSTPSLAIILQGRNPQKLLLTRNRINDLNTTGDVYLAAWETPFKNKWFKLPKINSVPSKLP